jgi:hypothetical protein
VVDTGLAKEHGQGMPTTTKTKPRRDKMIGVKVTDDEYEIVRRLAFEARMSLGAFIRDRVIGTKKK